jgi:hypothetical protein
MSKVSSGCCALLGLALGGCGQTTKGSDGWQPVSGTAGAPGGPAPSAGGIAGATASAGAAGEASATLGPPADISGRWGMFDFEDPVGVQLLEAPDGTLSGRGCAAGAPGYQDGETSLCGDAFGKVVGHTASFGFGIGEAGGAGYSFQVTIAQDAQRMTGIFNNGFADGASPIAWLRVAPDEIWLERAPYNEKDALTGRYELSLLASESSGNEYVAGQKYSLGYWRHALRGDLGSFWSSEMSDPDLEASPLRVGPVPPTTPDLPYVLSLDFELTGFTHVTAHTPSGGKYVFSVLKL